MIDELSMLRDAKPATVEPDPVVLLRARRSLIRRGLATRRSRRYTVRAVSAVAATAVVLAVVGVSPWPGNDSGASAEAASVLNLSAATIENQPTAGPGQFTYVLSVQREWYRGPRDKAPGSATVAREGRRTFQAWVPGDPDARWTLRISEGGDVELAPGEASSQTIRGSQQRPEFYRSVPTSPKTMLAALEALGPSGDNDADDSVMEHATEILFDQLASPALQAEVVRAMTLIDGVTVLDPDADLGDRRGIAIGRKDDITQVVFDPDTHKYLGARGVREDAEWTGPDGAQYINSVLERTIVEDGPPTD